MSIYRPTYKEAIPSILVSPSVFLSVCIIRRVLFPQRLDDPPDSSDDKVILTARPAEEDAGVEILRQFAFSSALQYMSVIARKRGEIHCDLFTKGSPERIQTMCRNESGGYTVLDTRSHTHAHTLIYQERVVFDPISMLPVIASHSDLVRPI